MIPLHDRRTCSKVRYLLDTNIVSAVVRAPGGRLAERLSAMPRSEFGISIIVACELRYGAARKRSARLSSQLEAVLEGVDILPLEEQADRHYGEIRTELERIGRPIGHNAVPALLTNRSTGPRRSSVAATARLASSPLRTSAT